ncbi:MAG: chromosomal replication initiator protein DnaA [Candidatus Binatia bacterium]
MDIQTFWNETVRKLEGRISDNDFGCWLQSIQPIELHERSLRAEVPSAMHRDQICARLRPEIAAVLEEQLGPGADLVLSVNKSRQPPAAEAKPSARPQGEAYTFENFVVGRSNQLAYSGACEVAARPGSAHNPLFLHGGVGLGKTHLASAVASHLARGVRRRILCLSAESFANDLIRAFVTNATEAFRARIRHLDVLVVDDIQFLAGKERMQEEFFHTFNALYAAGKQIMLASDQPPRDIPNLEDRLRNRFESGLIARIQSPESTLRLAILLRKAAAIGFDLPKDVAQWVAAKVVSSVRELEGALHRLVAACRSAGRALDLDFAMAVLRPILRTPPPKTLEQIQRLVADNFSMRLEDLVCHRQQNRLRVPRQIAMYLARHSIGATYAEIAAAFGGRDHSTIIHTVRIAEERRQRDSEFARLVDDLGERFASA